MHIDQLKPNVIVRGPLFPEPVQVIVTIPMGNAVKLIGKGLITGQVHEPILTAEQLAKLEASPDREPFDGDPHRFRLGIEALRLGLAYEYDPYFSLSIARVDPLPHQLEAVYDYFLKLPRIRFLLADDPGAGKTIMAGLLLKELKIRGLVTRTLIVTPANLSFQWQREMQDKFREHFEMIRGDVLRANYGSNPWQEKTQVVTSISWVSRIEDAKDSLLRSHWDLIIVDEAHKMSAYSADKKTLAYRLGEALSTMTDHYLLMTATPHKGDPQNFCLFLELLDRDVYGDVKSLEEAMRRNSAPFYLRRTKEALVTLPRPGHRPGETSSSPSATFEPSSSSSMKRNGTSTMPSRAMSKTNPSKRPPMTPHVAEPSCLPWPCCNGASPPASMPHAAAWNGCARSVKDPGRPGRVPPGTDRSEYPGRFR